MPLKILAINPGSTSTKIAVYEDERACFTLNVDHPAEEVARFSGISDQFEMRRDLVLATLHAEGFRLEELAAVVGRGGMVGPMKSGAYEVNEAMVKRLRTNPVQDHASNLGGLIAFEIARRIGVKAYIYDSVMVDELPPVAKVTGLPELPRISTSHVLNSRAMAIRCAKLLGRDHRELCLLVAHLGGGISCGLYDRGRLIDVLTPVEGPFSPERSGRVPAQELVDLCFSGRYDRKAMQQRLAGKGGIKAYLGTVDIREVIRMAEGGHAQAALLLDAMCYQVAKGIGELATVVCGKVDRIILTGGMAHAGEVTRRIQERITFIAPVEILPGENEMESLVLGTLRVLRGEEQAWEYVDQEG